MSRRLLGIRFTGSGMKPGGIRSKEIAEIIEAYEDMIVSVVTHENPELHKDIIVVGLTNITDESIGLQFLPNVPDLTFPAARKVSNAFDTLDFNILPSSAVKSAAKIISFVKKHECEAEIIEIEDNEYKKLAIITPSTAIPTTPVLTGETTIYGEITRVGGIDPRVQLKTVDGQTIYCDVSRELARELGHKLYSPIALSGKAIWDTDSLVLEEFQIKEVLDYEQVSLSDAFVELREAAGNSFEHVDNVSEFATQLRRGEL
ncbi:MAG: hypothetical protein R3264_09005 [Anaerolineae bacterium]|nr:hypothetical protein [Anaerolineae bacterium]